MLIYKRIWLLGAPSEQRLQHRPSRPFPLEILHAHARIRARLHRICANALSPFEGEPDNFVYSPQRSSNSATVQWLFSIPAAIAGVIFKALWVLTKLLSTTNFPFVTSCKQAYK